MMSTSAAAEYLRGFGQVGDSLESCLQSAQKHAHPDSPPPAAEFERVMAAARALGLR